MSQTDQDLDRLSELLFALPQENFPMTLSELDGYLTGVLACPEMIPPSDWLRHVWGETAEANFSDLKTAQETINAVMAHYNSIALTLRETPYLEPIYELDPNSDETLWEPWVDGFTKAMGLRPGAWTALIDRADDEARTSLIFLMALQDIYDGESQFTEERIDEIDLEAPDLIPNCVAAILLQSRPDLGAAAVANFPGAPFQTGPRPGRNDPCPCGSGRKYKQCCGKN